MNLQISDILVWATKRTFSAMLDWNIEHFEKPDLPEPESDVSGIIGLSGDVTGSIVLIVPETIALRATSGLLGESVEELNRDVVDTIGELTNIIAGGAKSRIDLKVNLSLPTVVTGSQHCVAYDSQAVPVVVHFQHENETFGVKYCIDTRSQLGASSTTVEMAI